MSSFEVADCPVRMNVAESFSGSNRVQKGSLILTVRNKTPRLRTARLSIQAQGATKAEWFAFEGALPTSPREIERDLKANATESIQVNVVVPGSVTPGSQLFNVRITAEDDPDNDFVTSPNVAFDLAAWSQTPPPPEKFPWWAIAIAVALVALIGGAAGYLLLGSNGKEVPPILGMPWNEAAAQLKTNQIDAEIVTVINPSLLPPSKFAHRVVAIDPGECEEISETAKLKVYLGATMDPGFCPSCNNKNWASLDPPIQQLITDSSAIAAERAATGVVATVAHRFFFRWRPRPRPTATPECKR